MRRASLVAQWLRICLPMQGTWVPSLAWEDPTCLGATKAVGHNYEACALEPVSHDYGAPAEPAAAPQQARSGQWEAWTPQLRAARAGGNQTNLPAGTKTQHSQKQINTKRKIQRKHKKIQRKKYQEEVQFLQRFWRSQLVQLYSLTHKSLLGNFPKKKL